LEIKKYPSNKPNRDSNGINSDNNNKDKNEEKKSNLFFAYFISLLNLFIYYILYIDYAKTPKKNISINVNNNAMNLTLKYHSRNLSNPFHENTPLHQVTKSVAKVKISPIKHTISSMNKLKQRELNGNNHNNDSSHFTDIQGMYLIFYIFYYINI
jgi:hypothetical protein